MLMPLKEKYLSWKSHKFGKYKSRTGNSHGPTPKWGSSTEGLGVRRTCGLGAVGNPYERGGSR